MGQPAPVVRLLWISWPVAALSAIRLRYVYLRPAGVQRRVWPRLDRQRTAHSAPPDGRCRPREDRDHGGLDYSHPSDRQRLGGIFGRRVADRVRYLPRSLHAFGSAADRRRLDGAVRRRGATGPAPRSSREFLRFRSLKALIHRGGPRSSLISCPGTAEKHDGFLTAHIRGIKYQFRVLKRRPVYDRANSRRNSYRDGME